MLVSESEISLLSGHYWTFLRLGVGSFFMVSIKQQGPTMASGKSGFQPLLFSLCEVWVSPHYKWVSTSVKELGFYLLSYVEN